MGIRKSTDGGRLRHGKPWWKRWSRDDTELFALSFGRGKRSSPVLYGSRYLLLFVLCAVILTVGMFCERFLTPLLFRLALGEVLPS